MEERKTLVEQLRDMVELSIESNQDPTVHADAIIGHLCVSRSDERELFTAIADRIEREYMPMPRFEDGEPVKVGDLVLWDDGGAKRVEDIKVEVHIEGSCGTCNSVLKRCVDTLERIEKDAMKMYNDYWGCGDSECHCCPVKVDGKRPCERYGDGVSCLEAQKLDLLRRQRELLERGQE